jgi:hypothetical protein
LPDLDEGTTDVEEDAGSRLERSIRLEDIDDDYDGFASDDGSLGDFMSSPDGLWSVPNGDDDGIGNNTSTKRGRGVPNNGGGGNDRVSCDFGAALSTIDTTGFFDALEEQYLDALEEDHGRTKKRKSSSVRFADESGRIERESSPPKDGIEGVDALAAVGMTTPSDPFDLYDEIRDSTHLQTSKDRFDASSEIDYRSDTDFDDPDDASIYDEIFGDEVDSIKKEDEERAQEKQIMRGFLYSMGGMALLGGIGWASTRILNAFRQSEDENGGANMEVMYADRGADVSHAVDLSLDTAHVAELIAEAALITKVTLGGSPAVAASLNNGAALAAGAANANAGAAAAAQ